MNTINIPNIEDIGDWADKVWNDPDSILNYDVLGKMDEIVKGAGDSVADATGVSGVLDFFKNLFSVNTGARIAAVIVGFLLLGAAVWALANAPSKG